MQKGGDIALEKNNFPNIDNLKINLDIKESTLKENFIVKKSMVGYKAMNLDGNKLIERVLGDRK